MKFNFSIVIPTKNEERNIIKCINSIFNQKQKKIEILIIDSFSNDKTIFLLKGLINKKKEKI